MSRDPVEIGFGDLPDEIGECDKCDTAYVRLDERGLPDCECQWCEVCEEKTIGCECHETGDNNDE